MLTVLRAALRSGRVTTSYPALPNVPPPTVRGAPTIDPTRCDCSAECVGVCPADAITLVDEPDGGRTWRLDLAPCVFCGLCAEACPAGAIMMSHEFELATRSRDDLLTIVRHRPPGLPELPLARSRER